MRAIANSLHPDARPVNEGKVLAHSGSSRTFGSPPPGAHRAFPSGIEWVGAATAPTPALVSEPAGCGAVTRSGSACKGRATGNGRCMAHQ